MLREEYPHESVATLCGLFGKKRQWYYASIKAGVSGRQRVKPLADMIGYYRLCRLRIGGLKLFHLLEKDLGYVVTPGRDSFLKIYESEGFELSPDKCRRTTGSNHVYKGCPNLIKGKDARYPSHAWVPDTTYVWILGDMLCLHLVADAYSHAALGWCLSDSLGASYTTEALRMAIRIAGSGSLCGTIYHSDRGSQYTSEACVDCLMEYHTRINMAEGYKSIDNAMTERQSGIFEVEWICEQEVCRDREQTINKINRIISFYNN